jgi:hypothetical protein
LGLTVGSGQADGEKATVHLAVLNGTTTAGLAREFGLILTTAGCVTAQISNAPHQHFPQTLLVNRRLSLPAAAALAARLGEIPFITEKDPRTTEDAVLVLGADCDRVRAALAQN